MWVDLQNDVTADDIGLAVRENFSAVEHLKRYTTVGMGTDQGKTSNVNALAVLAAGTSRKIADLGTTTFRPPFVPVSMATIAGSERGELQAPIRRLPAENTHREERAYFRDYGGVLRPAWYGPQSDAIAAECVAARTKAVVFDASSLGKIDVIGPQAAALLDFVYYTPMSSLAVGRARYGLTLSEAGIVADDGVVLRLGPAHFVVSCSSSPRGGHGRGAGGVAAGPLRPRPGLHPRRDGALGHHRDLRPACEGHRRRAGAPRGARRCRRSRT